MEHFTLLGTQFVRVESKGTAVFYIVRKRLQVVPLKEATGQLMRHGKQIRQYHECQKVGHPQRPTNAHGINLDRNVKFRDSEAKILRLWGWRTSCCEAEGRAIQGENWHCQGRKVWNVSVSPARLEKGWLSFHCSDVVIKSGWRAMNKLTYVAGLSIDTGKQLISCSLSVLRSTAHVNIIDFARDFDLPRRR